MNRFSEGSMKETERLFQSDRVVTKRCTWWSSRRWCDGTLTNERGGYLSIEGPYV